MAGRGIRPGSICKEMDGCVKKLAKPFAPNSSDVNIETIIDKIKEIIVTDINPVTLNEARVLFIQYLSKYEKPFDKIFLRFHSEALNDSGFGEKFAIFFKGVNGIIVNEECVRGPVLCNMQKDYENRDTLFHSDNEKFLNAVMLLGNVNKFLKINNKKLQVFIGPLFDYMDLLLQGEEEKYFRVLTTQITLFDNDEELKNVTDRYVLLQLNLRKALIERNLSIKSKYWILLALDYISNNIQPLNDALRNFYLEKLGDDYLNLELRIKSFGKIEDPVPSTETSAAMKLVRSRILASEMQKTTEAINDVFENIASLKVAEKTSHSGRGLNNSKSEENDELCFHVSNVKDDDNKLIKREPKVYQGKNSESGLVNFDVVNDNDDDEDKGSDEDEKELYGIQIDKDKSAGSALKKSDFNKTPSSNSESKEVSESRQDKTVEVID